VREIDLVGAELLRVIIAFRRASHELLVLGADQLITPLRAAVQPGVRTRATPHGCCCSKCSTVAASATRGSRNRYCITYEVSPPSWSRLRRVSKRVQPLGRPADRDDGGLHWRGLIRGNGGRSSGAY
jgi:hypothetical protein